jgi:hypothetical protein
LFDWFDPLVRLGSNKVEQAVRSCSGLFDPLQTLGWWLLLNQASRGRAKKEGQDRGYDWDRTRSNSSEQAWLFGSIPCGDWDRTKQTILFPLFHRAPPPFFLPALLPSGSMRLDAA